MSALRKILTNFFKGSNMKCSEIRRKFFLKLINVFYCSLFPCFYNLLFCFFSVPYASPIPKASTSNQNWKPNWNSNLKRVRCDLIADYKLAIAAEDKYESKEEKGPWQLIKTLTTACRPISRPVIGGGEKPIENGSQAQIADIRPPWPNRRCWPLISTHVSPLLTTFRPLKHRWKPLSTWTLGLCRNYTFLFIIAPVIVTPELSITCEAYPPVHRYSTEVRLSLSIRNYDRRHIRRAHKVIVPHAKVMEVFGIVNNSKL